MEQNKIVILIPAYNEADNLKKLLPKLKTYNVYIINDGSTDKTLEIVKKNKCKYINIKVNSGYENAVLTGLKYLRKKKYKYILTFDADGQHQIKDIKKIENIILKKDIDLYIFNRIVKNRFSEKLLEIIFKNKYCIKDPLSGLKAFKTTTLKKINLNNINNFFLVDLVYIYLKKNYKIENIKIITKKRIGKARVGSLMKVNLKILYISLMYIFKN